MNGIIWCATCRQPQPLGTKVCPGCSRSFDRHLTRAVRHELQGTTLEGRWTLKRLLGQGRRGEVFEADDHVLRRDVVVKLLRTGSDYRRLERDLLTVAGVRHFNICDVYGYGLLSPGRPFVVLERLSGESLQALIRGAHRTMPLTTTIDLFTQILSGLHAAHGARVAHSSLTPRSVFLVDRLGLSPIVKLLDFGVTPDGEGPNAYAAPEQTAMWPGDRRSDIFAVAAMLFEALTGQRPFPPGPVAHPGQALAHLRPDLPPTVVGVVARGLAWSPEHRFPDAHAMQRELLAGLRPAP